ncbi:uracil phosphoribosyltransferase [Sulfobacillus harzensis]|uniref:Uracil phosphoribosyltransferase n=1 Tax=Sulfobacillus harzensis TaxID=2729629 RepID=A0A7Y0L0G9_9FIRM|nr:uracil phosphoribosyltransferase [Sulfobacillus harzensis]NMP21012.1 uracil phosphoribosyltransferase [Sulfobacillus harzensis]
MILVDHPLVRVHITALRNKATSVDAFRLHLTALARLMAFPVLGNLATQEIEVTTPMAQTVGVRLLREPILVPVLRAGLGLVEGFRDVIPGAVVSHLGMYRDHETLKPVRYYSNFPMERQNHPFILLDPMLATGGSAVDALDYLKSEGAQDIRLVSIIAAPEGVARVANTHPDVPVYTAALDKRLDEHGYIIPGLGDAGDRQFGTL